MRQTVHCQYGAAIGIGIAQLDIERTARRRYAGAAYLRMHVMSGVVVDFGMDGKHGRRHDHLSRGSRSDGANSRLFEDGPGRAQHRPLMNSLSGRQPGAAAAP